MNNTADDFKFLDLTELNATDEEFEEYESFE